MLEIRSSSANKESSRIKLVARAKPTETNTAWLARSGGVGSGDLVLLGGTNLTHFRLRFAQGDIRHDLLPSIWSHIVLVDRAAGRNDWRAWEVSLEGRDDVHLVPKNNGVRDIVLSAYDDPFDYPNIARLTIPRKKGSAVAAAAARDASGGLALDDHVRKFRRERLSLNIPALMTEWYGWVWGVPEKCNPLPRGLGIPSAVFIEAVYALLGVELTPGLASQSSCPEAIWQSARWWHDFYGSDASLCDPITGSYCVDQWEAAVLDRRSIPEDRAVRKSLYTRGIAPGNTRRKPGSR